MDAAVVRLILTLKLMSLGRGASQMAPGLASEGKLVQHLHSAERVHRHLIYLADRVPSSWTDRCLRQCDRVMVVVDARTPPTLTPWMPNSGFSYSLASRCIKSRPAAMRCAIGAWAKGDSGCV